MNIKPLPGEALIEILPEDAATPSGIVLPQVSLSPEEVQARHVNPQKPRDYKGLVRKIGPWPKLGNGLAVMPEFKIGDTVLVGFNCGTPMRYGHGNFRIVRQGDVIAVLTDSVEVRS